ncbi:MAG: 30S ribosomal protein S18 [Planctomycetes bacterium]|nr:30S ribosomal protein S18 [Planctomycetota bacterium]
MARMQTGKRKGRSRRRRLAEAAKCRFCREKIREIDYKEVATLHKLVSAQGKLFPRKRSGNCARHQRSSALAIKRARFMALLPFVG